MPVRAKSQLISLTVKHHSERRDMIKTRLNMESSFKHASATVLHSVTQKDLYLVFTIKVTKLIVFTVSII